MRHIFPIVPEFKQSGFYIAPGFTYMYPGSNHKDSINNDQQIPYETNPEGSLRFMLQLGYFRTFKEPFFWDFLEAGLSYKILRGEEEYHGDFSGFHESFDDKSTFEDQFAGVFFRATKVSQFSNYLFVTNSIGINGDYLINENRKINGNFHNTENIGPESPIIQAHYQLGFGIKASKRILVIPTIETPILNILPFDNGKSTLEYFHSRYRPILFTIKIMFLRPDPLNCNAPTFEGPQPKM